MIGTFAIDPEDCDAVLALVSDHDFRPRANAGPAAGISQHLEPALFRRLVGPAARWGIERGAGFAFWTVGVARYDIGEGCVMHVDAFSDDEREGYPNLVSAVVQLSASFDYEGGTLRFPGEDIDASRQRGAAYVYRSMVDWHGVEPVTRGRRFSLLIHGFGRCHSRSTLLPQRARIAP